MHLPASVQKIAALSNQKRIVQTAKEGVRRKKGRANADSIDELSNPSVSYNRDASKMGDIYEEDEDAANLIENNHTTSKISNLDSFNV